MASTETLHDSAAATSVPCTGNDPVNSCAVYIAGHVAPDGPEMCPTGTEWRFSGAGQPSTSQDGAAHGSNVTDQDDMHAGERHEARYVSANA